MKKLILIIGMALFGQSLNSTEAMSEFAETKIDAEAKQIAAADAGASKKAILKHSVRKAIDNSPATKKLLVDGLRKSRGLPEQITENCIMPYLEQPQSKIIKKISTFSDSPLIKLKDGTFAMLCGIMVYLFDQNGTDYGCFILHSHRDIYGFEEFDKNTIAITYDFPISGRTTILYSKNAKERDKYNKKTRPLEEDYRRLDQAIIAISPLNKDYGSYELDNGTFIQKNKHGTFLKGSAFMIDQEPEPINFKSDNCVIS